MPIIQNFSLVNKSEIKITLPNTVVEWFSQLLLLSYKNGTQLGVSIIVLKGDSTDASVGTPVGFGDSNHSFPSFSITNVNVSNYTVTLTLNQSIQAYGNSITYAL